MTSEKESTTEDSSRLDTAETVGGVSLNAAQERKSTSHDKEDEIKLSCETQQQDMKMSRTQKRRLKKKEDIITLFFASFIVLICLVVPLLSINDAIQNNITNNTLKLQMEVISAEQNLELFDKTQDPLYLHQLLNNLYIIDTLTDQTENFYNSNFSLKVGSHKETTLSQVININITHLESSLSGEVRYNKAIINLLNSDFSILAEHFKANPLMNYDSFIESTESVLLD